MRTRTFNFWLVNASFLFYLLTPLSTTAQVVPDATLPINSSIKTQGNTSFISGGTRAGGNLFHSFFQFSVPTNGIAYFNNALDVQNIISRVTGGSASNIDGLLKANGTANLFLLNPNGIFFGRNSSLNLGGSFLGSTATSINFADGTQFSATDLQTKPLLTINIPIGLQFGSNPGAIQVEGTSYGLTAPETLFSPIVRSSNLTGLRVEPGKTLALVGGDVVLKGGTLTAEGGRIELGSIGAGLVSLNPTNEGWILGYEGVSSFRDIQLSQQALVDTSGTGSGSIQLSGRRVAFTDGSVALIQNQGSQASGNISVNASESLELSGTSPDGSFPSILRTEAVGSGDGGDIDVSTRQLFVQGGASIGSRTYSDGKGGNLTLTASESLQLLGFSTFNPFLTSNISASTLASGNAGNIKVSTRWFVAQDGGTVTSLTRGIGNGGNLILNATDSAEVINSQAFINTESMFVPSNLATTAFKAGKAGNVEINTPRLVVGNEAEVDSSTVGSGSAGSVNINAPDSVKVSGAVDSSAATADAFTQELFGAPPIVSGASGDVTINTGQLSVTNGGLVTALNKGPSKPAGILTVNARSIFLNNQGGIIATAASGKGGNIFLNAQNLQLDYNSSINASAGGGGNGGNITIKTQVLPILNSSDIRADAQGGTGGRVGINTQGLFRSPNSNITATSQRGPQFNGIVQINVPAQLNFARAAANPTPQPQSPQVASVCSGRSGSTKSSLVNSGTGGTPPTAGSTLNSNTVWQDNFTPSYKNQAAKPKKHSSKEPLPIIPATGVVFYPDGTMSFVASNSSIPTGASSGCSEASNSK